MWQKEKNRLSFAIIISILVHILGIILLTQFHVLSYEVPPPDPADVAPIVLEFEPTPPPATPEPQAEQSKSEQEKPVPQNPEPPEPEQAAPDELIVTDNPDANEEEPSVAGNFIAEKSSKSAAPEINPDLEKSLIPPQQDPAKSEAPQPASRKTEHAPQPSPPPTNVPDYQGKEAWLAMNKPIPFTKSALTKTPQLETSQEALEEFQAGEAQEGPNQEIKEGNRQEIYEKFSAEKIGKLAYGTVASDLVGWYWRHLEKVGRLLFPSSAYYMGLIEGNITIVVFVHRTGKVLGYEVKEFTGHPSLKETTVAAVLASDPWEAFPPNTPYEVLEVWYRLDYPNFRKVQERLQRQHQKN